MAHRIAIIPIFSSNVFLFLLYHYKCNLIAYFSETYVDENQSSKPKPVNRGAVANKTAQQMAHGFVTLFEKELDQVQHNLKEVL